MLVFMVTKDDFDRYGIWKTFLGTKQPSLTQMLEFGKWAVFKPVGLLMQATIIDFNTEDDTLESSESIEISSQYAPAGSAAISSSANRSSDGVPKAPPPAPPAPPPPPCPVLRSSDGDDDEPKCKKLSWKELKINLNGTIWDKINNELLEVNDLFDKNEVLELFREKPRKSRKFSTSASNIPTSEEIQTITGKKQLVISIALAHHQLNADNLVTAVNKVDTRLLQPDFLSAIESFLPDQNEETSLIKKYAAKNVVIDEQVLTDPEKFSFLLSSVPEFRKKIRAMVFQSSFHDRVSAICKNLDIVRDAVLELQLSERLEKLLKYILSVGRIMNNTSTKAFNIDFLSTATCFKSSDGDTSFLMYVISKLAADDVDAIHLAEELPSLQQAAKVCLNDIDRDSTELAVEYSSVSQELDSLTEESEIFKEFLREGKFDLNNIKRKRRQVQHDLNTLAAYFGIDPSKSKPMDVFVTVKQFINDLATATENLSKIASTRKNSSRAMMRSTSTPNFKRSSRNSSFRGSRNNSAKSSRNSSARSSFRRSNRSQSFGSNASDATSGSQEFNDSIMFGEGRSRSSSKSSSSEMANMNFDVDISESRTSTMSKSDKEDLMNDSTYSTMSNKGSLKQRSVRRIKEQAGLNEERERETEREPDLSRYKDLIKKWEEDKSNGTRDASRNRRANEKKSPGRASEEFMRKQEQIEKVLLSPVREKPERKGEGTPERKQQQDTEMVEDGIQMKEIRSKKVRPEEFQLEMTEKVLMSPDREKPKRKGEGMIERNQEGESRETDIIDGGLQMKEIRSKKIDANLENTSMSQAREKLERERERKIEINQQKVYHGSQDTDMVDDGFQMRDIRSKKIDANLEYTSMPETREKVERERERKIERNQQKVYHGSQDTDMVDDGFQMREIRSKKVGPEDVKLERKEETRRTDSNILLDENGFQGIKKERKEETRMNHSKRLLNEKENQIIDDDSYYDKEVIGEEISRLCLDSPGRTEIRMDREPDLSKYRHLVKPQGKRPRPALKSKEDDRESEMLSNKQQESESKRYQEEFTETLKSRNHDRPKVSSFDREKHEQFRSGDKSVFVKKIRSRNVVESPRQKENSADLDRGVKSSALQSRLDSNCVVNGKNHAKEAGKVSEENSRDESFSDKTENHGIMTNQSLNLHSNEKYEDVIKEKQELNEGRNEKQPSSKSNGEFSNSNSDNSKAMNIKSEKLENSKGNSNSSSGSSNFKRGGNRNSFSRGRNSFRNSFKSDRGPKKVSVKAMQAKDIPKSNSLATSRSDSNFANTKRRRTRSEGIQAVVLKPGFIAKNMPMKLEIKPVDTNNNEIEQKIEIENENESFKSVDDDTIMLQRTDPPVLRRTKSAVIRRNIREAKIIFFL